MLCRTIGIRRIQLKSAFPEYFQPSDDEFKGLWEKANVVLDANVLLNLYQYSSTTRKTILSDLTDIKERLWIPSQVAEEYLKNRISTIKKQDVTYQEIQDEIGKILPSVEKILGKASVHLTLDKEAMKKTVSKAVQSIYRAVTVQEKKHLKEFIVDPDEDEVYDAVTSIFQNNVGRRWLTDELVGIFEMGRERYANEIPPGYKDGRKDANQYGDLVVWKQILEWSQNHAKPVIFVTDDQKEDWWAIDKSGKILGPRPELLAEHYVLTGKPIYLYRSEQFWKYAGIHLGTMTDLNSIKEIKRVAKAEKEQEETIERGNSAYRAALLPWPTSANPKLEWQTLMPPTFDWSTVMPPKLEWPPLIPPTFDWSTVMPLKFEWPTVIPPKSDRPLAKDSSNDESKDEGPESPSDALVEKPESDSGEVN